MIMEQFVTIVGWVIICALIALLGRKRKIGYGWSFVLCLLVSPIIGLIITLCSKKKDVDFVNMD